MSDYEVRASTRLLVLGPIVKSMAFWLEILFLFGAAFELTQVWRHVRTSSALSTSLDTTLFLMVFILVFASYIYFSDLMKLRKQAQKDPNEETQRMLCRSADMASKMFYFGAGSMIVGLQLCLIILYSVK
jgi:hypothetical protein